MSKLVSRAEAGLRPPKGRTPLPNPEGNTGHYGGPSPWGSSTNRSSATAFVKSTNHNRCATIWRAYQAYHMDSRGWNDIAYNSGVCPHGYRFEGRGVGVRSGANGTNAGNSRSTATCYIAGVGDPLTEEAKVAFRAEALRLSNRTMIRWAHSDWKSTACPGTPLRNWIKSAQGISPPTAPPKTTPVTSARPQVRRGSRGEAVREVQNLINGIVGQRRLAVDGIFGSATDREVRNFQRLFKLGVDGIVGPKTWQALLAIHHLRVAG